jgi:CheY-like chemotaxis protein
MATRHVLYIEDDTRHAAALATAVETLDLPIILHVVESATQGLEFLGQRGRHPSAPIASVILLDLGLPLVNGHEVLQGLAEDAIFSAIPVVVYTRSRSEADRYLAARHKAEFIVKDGAWTSLVDVANRINDLAHGRR